MSRIVLYVALAVGSAWAHVGQAQDYRAGSIAIEHPWARATVPGQPAGGGFLTLKNAGAADRLVGVATPVAARGELHSMRMQGDVMRMEEVVAVEVPAGRTVELGPGGYHLMFFNLKAPLQAGTRFPATLRFEKAGEVTVEFEVMAPNAAPTSAAHARH